MLPNDDVLSCTVSESDPALAFASDGFKLGVELSNNRGKAFGFGKRAVFFGATCHDEISIKSIANRTFARLPVLFLSRNNLYC